MPRCRLCGGRSNLFLSEHRLPLCKDCYPKWFLRITERTIEKWKMFDKNEKVLVAVSGGKDSIALWYSLSKLGYNTSAVHIVISETEYSLKSENFVKEISNIIKSPYHIIRIKNELGKDIDEISKELKREHCSLCSIIKRRLLNKFAFENNYDVVVTGHNLDDETASLLGNVLRWDLKYLLNQMPVLEKKDNFVKKAKPFIRFTDKEIKLFSQIEKLPFIDEKCPFSKGAHSILYKEVFEKIEKEMPPSKWTFYSNFVKKIHKILLDSKQKEENLNKCRICNYPSSKEICSFCRIKEKLTIKN
jgi:uncharacterized protein (TIGR00269 family)